MWRKRPPRGSGGSGELAACPQAQRHAGQEGQARRWAGPGRAGPGGSSSPGKGQPGLARSLDPAVREARGSAGSGTRRPPGGVVAAASVVGGAPAAEGAGKPLVTPFRTSSGRWPGSPLPAPPWPQVARLATGERGPVSGRGLWGPPAGPAPDELRRAPELSRKLPARCARRTGSLPRPPLSRRVKEKPLMALHLQSAGCAHWRV